jgi:hypothetical protein
MIIDVACSRIPVSHRVTRATTARDHPVANRSFATDASAMSQYTSTLSPCTRQRLYIHYPSKYSNMEAILCALLLEDFVCHEHAYA